MCGCYVSSFFFFNDTATTEIYTLSLHDALPISERISLALQAARRVGAPGIGEADREGYLQSLDGITYGDDPADGVVRGGRDRKSTRLNSSHANISYAVFCLKKKKEKHISSDTNT